MHILRMLLCILCVYRDGWRNEIGVSGRYTVAEPMNGVLGCYTAAELMTGVSARYAMAELMIGRMT